MFLSDMFRQNGATLVGSERVQRREAMPTSTLPTGLATSFPSQIASLRRDLELPEAQEPETHVRVLTILGMLEVNYDSGMARQSWAEVQSLASSQHHYLLASRAIGEQGIAAFLLGDIATTRRAVTPGSMPE
jgi:hypothetical protein